MQKFGIQEILRRFLPHRPSDLSLRHHPNDPFLSLVNQAQVKACKGGLRRRWLEARDSRREKWWQNIYIYRRGRKTGS